MPVYEYLLDQHEVFHLRVGVVISQTPRSVFGGADCESCHIGKR